MCGSHPFRVLRAKPLWIANGAITGALALLFTLFYVGADEGAAVGGKQVSAGAQITVSIENSSVSGDKVDWKVMEEGRAKEELGEGKLFGALVVPDDSTASVAAPTGITATGTPSCPSVTVLPDQSVGSVGSGLARQATTQAAESPSLQVGKELTVRSGAGQAEMSTAARVPLADPVAVTVKDGHPLHSHGGRGMAALSYALVLVVCGMPSANVISGQPVHALGRTLAISGTLVIGVSLLMGTLVTVGAVGIMGMDAPHLPLLWLCSAAAIAVSGIGALTLLAVFGTPGMLVLTPIFIGTAVPMARAITPIEALPGFYRFLAEFEPLWQITDGLRSILYYDAQADAGLPRGWVTAAVGLTAAVLFGFGVTGWYDREGPHRIPPRRSPRARRPGMAERGSPRTGPLPGVAPVCAPASTRGAHTDRARRRPLPPGRRRASERTQVSARRPTAPRDT
ncbi:DUF3533 domain-containing protein [Streptomyces sp. NPDC093105]|uniref:DUF3533 domain-containing protein n=1 Tax=Streptomyces sp. NPDC093105 TaxID=3366029 RepID=UPI0037FDB569